MRIFSVLVILIFTSYANTFSQTIKISGQVKTQKDSLLPGASIVVKGNKRSFVANKHGEFFIKKLKLPATLLVASIGCRTQEFYLQKADTTRYLAVRLSALVDELADEKREEEERRERLEKM